MALEMYDKLNALAESFDKEIHAKLHSGTSTQRMTHRRLAIVQSQRNDADRMQKAQQILRALAKKYIEGTVPPELKSLTSKRAALESLWSSSPLRPFVLQLLTPEPIEKDIDRQIREIKDRLFGQKIPGFFPMPPALVDKMLSYTPTIAQDAKVLEPSAGMGDIADKIQPYLAEWNRVHCCETQHSLREMLLLKNYVLVGDDFLDYELSDDPADALYDLIVMNPPFEDRQDMEHIEHAYSLLKPDGILIALSSPAWEFRGGRDYDYFRNFIKQTNAHVETIEAGAFSKGFRSTNVASRLIVIGL